MQQYAWLVHDILPRLSQFSITPIWHLNCDKLRDFLENETPLSLYISWNTAYSLNPSIREKNYWNYSGNDTIFDRSNVACFLSLPFAKRDAKCLDNGERRRQEEDGVGRSIDRISMKSESMSAQYFTIKSDNHGPSHLCNIHRARYATDCVSSLEVPPQRLTSRSWKGDLHRRTSMRCPAMRKRIFY